MKPIHFNLYKSYRFLLGVIFIFTLGCNPDSDPNVKKNNERYKDDPQILSSIILHYPIYACATGVVVQGFDPGAEIIIYANGAQIGSATSFFSGGDAVNGLPAFTVGQVITAKQKRGGVLSPESNKVTVTSYLDDYPNGLPKPRISPTPIYECGAAVGFQDVIPGAWVKVFSEKPNGAGFDPPVEVGNANNFPYAIISPAFVKGSRITIQSGICAATSPTSDPQIVQPEPSSIPITKLDPVYDGGNIVTVWGPTGNPSPCLDGATLEIDADNLPPGNQRIGGQPTPGGGQQVYVSPAIISGVHYTSTQALCTKSKPSDPQTGHPCSDLPPAKIKIPAPGDTQIQVTEYVPGSVILVYDGNFNKIGEGGPPLLNLIRPVVDGEQIVVIQKLGACTSQWIYVINVTCPYGDPAACGGEWPSFRQNRFRDAQQLQNSDLSNPYKVKTLKVQWQFQPPGADLFRASPIIYKGKLYIGNGNGFLYCLDAASGTLLWQYPKAGDPALTSQFTCNPSSHGIASSASIGRIRQEKDVVIFGAPDQSIGSRLGSGRLFALDANTGAEVWKSPEIAVLNGTTEGSTSEIHEQIGYSSPLVYGDMVYIGVANHCDNPIQNGKVVAVDINTGNIVKSFHYQSTNTRGGGVWSSVAGGFDGVYITTGNSREGNPTEPSVNNALSMLKLDPSTGDIIWKFQPVPFNLDDDPDWASGPALVNSGAGPVAVSTQKDGWSYAVLIGGASPAAPSVLWQFPSTGFPFTTGDGTTHGDSRYLRPGAAWGDVFITETGGESVTTDINNGYSRLHALNINSGSNNRVRWQLQIPSTFIYTDPRYRIGPPSVTKGIIYVGTSEGHVVAIADPSAWPSVGSQCSMPGVAVSDCEAMGYQIVPIPAVLLDLALPDSKGISTEPVLAEGRLYIANDSGILFMISN